MAISQIPNNTVTYGLRDDGEQISASYTAEGHAEVAIHSPTLPFGSVHVENLTPIFQTDAVYGINSSEVLATTGHAVTPGTANSGSNTGVNNVFKCSTGTTQYSFATMQSRRRLRYRAGQGIVGRFAGLFSTPAASSIIVAGYGTGESGYYFGYNGTSFGVLKSAGGVREIQTLTVTTASTGTGNYAVQLSGVTTNVTATNNSSTVKTAYEISQGTYPGWDAIQRGSTVVFLAQSVGNKAGAFSLGQAGGGTPAAGTFTETLAGVASTDTWVAQADWNGDKLNGTGPSGITLDPSKGNVYQIGIQYLGFGDVIMEVEIDPQNSNNPTFVTAHIFENLNSLTSPHITQPSFPFTMASYSSGSTTDVSVSVGSFSGFVEGQKRLTGPRMTYFNTAGVTSSTSVYTPIFTFRNDRVYATRANQAVVNLLSVGGATKSTNGVTSFYLIKNATLSAGTPNFTQFATTSCTYWDVAATACTFTTNDQVIWSGSTTGDGELIFAFEDDITLQPGETVTLAVRSVTGTATCIGQINTREDQ